MQFSIKDGVYTTIRGDLTESAFGFVLVNEHHIISHEHNFTNASPKFDLHDLVGGDNKSYALNLRHDECEGISKLLFSANRRISGVKLCVGSYQSLIAIITSLVKLTLDNALTS